MSMIPLKPVTPQGSMFERSKFHPCSGSSLPLFGARKTSVRGRRSTAVPEPPCPCSGHERPLFGVPPVTPLRGSACPCSGHQQTPVRGSIPHPCSGFCLPLFGAPTNPCAGFDSPPLFGVLLAPVRGTNKPLCGVRFPTPVRGSVCPCSGHKSNPPARDTAPPCAGICSCSTRPTAIVPDILTGPAKGFRGLCVV